MDQNCSSALCIIIVITIKRTARISLKSKSKCCQLQCMLIIKHFLTPFKCIFRGDFSLKIWHFLIGVTNGSADCFGENFTCHSDGSSILQQWKLEMGKNLSLFQKAKGKIEIRVTFLKLKSQIGDNFGAGRAMVRKMASEKLHFNFPYCCTSQGQTIDRNHEENHHHHYHHHHHHHHRHHHHHHHRQTVLWC